MVSFRAIIVIVVVVITMTTMVPLITNDDEVYHGCIDTKATTKAKTAGAAHGRRVSRSGGGARAAVDAGSAERPMSSGRGQETTTTTTTTVMRRQLAARNGPKAAWESGVVLKAGNGSKGPPSPTEAFGASGGPHRGILQRKENKESY